MNGDQQPARSTRRDSGAPGDAEPKKERRSFLRGVREHLRALFGLGRTLIEEPRAFPAQLRLHLLKWARATWNARGGGFYACGFVITFLYLEVKLLVTELFTSAGAGDFLLQQILQIVMRFTVDSLVNTLLALIWPAFVLQFSPLLGAIFLAAGYLLFKNFLKEPLTRFLFHDTN